MTLFASKDLATWKTLPLSMIMAQNKHSAAFSSMKSNRKAITMKLNIKATLKTIFLLFVYTLIWQILELAIDGYVTERPIDTIMLLLFTPFIYYSVNVITKKHQTYHDNNNNNNIDLSQIEHINQFDGIILVDDFEDGYQTYNILAVKTEKLKPVKTMLIAKYYDMHTAKTIFNIINQTYFTH